MVLLALHYNYNYNILTNIQTGCFYVKIKSLRTVSSFMNTHLTVVAYRSMTSYPVLGLKTANSLPVWGQNGNKR